MCMADVMSELLSKDRRVEEKLSQNLREGAQAHHTKHRLSLSTELTGRMRTPGGFSLAVNVKTSYSAEQT